MEAFGTSERKMGQLGILRRLESIAEDKEDKDKHKFDQAISARWVKNVDKRRLLGVLPGMADISGRSLVGIKLRPCMKESKVNTGKLELQMEDKHKGIVLACVMFPSNDQYFGTLQVHLNGFLYHDEVNCVAICFDEIEKCFFRLGDEKIPPILHFHMGQPTLITSADHGNSQTHSRLTTDIEFHMVMCGTDHDYNNKELKNFVEIMDARWNPSKSPCVFDELEKEYEFYGVLPSGERAAFVVTLYDLIVLVEKNAPFTVIPLLKIEFVNLAQVRPGEIDMAVILQESKSPFGVLEIRSIPLECLARIKDCLNFVEVKYCVNTREVDWEAIIKDIAAFPLEFIIKGGWDKFKLEDPETLAYYGQVKQVKDLDYDLVELLY